MKVLFAVSNESVSESVVKKYQKEYKEIITYKNVYYFNAILKEIQRDKSYDRIVISEDLEPFANNNYETIDRFIFDKLDSISDEATDKNGTDTPVILICTDRRSKSDSILVKFFGIGIYNAIIGQERSIDEVCRLIYKPRSKKEAKIYYKIESEDVNYQVESESDVSEVEIQNILTHYKRLGNNEDKYVESFASIASQYTDSQLRLIAKFLPLRVKAVLEANSPKYQEIMTGVSMPKASKKVEKEVETNYNNQYDKKKNKHKNIPEEPKDIINNDILETQLSKPKMTKPVVIPSAVDTTKVKKWNEMDEEDILSDLSPNAQQEETEEDILSTLDEQVEVEPEEIVAPKRRGRPKKIVEEIEEVSTMEEPKKRRGRPKKVQEQEESVDLFNLNADEEQASSNATTLPGFEDEEEEIQQSTSVGPTLPGFEEEEEEPQPMYPPRANAYQPNASAYENINPDNQYQPNTSSLSQMNARNTFGTSNPLTGDNKVVAFVGTSKNGTSFLINNLAQLVSSMGISTAVLDLTQNRNAYYIYTKNEEELRNIAYTCVDKLRSGIAAGISVNKNLSVYTTLPGEDRGIEDYENILSTLRQNYSLILLDCDFSTPIEYFESAQELYLIQSMDILTIQPLTAFLRDLKSKNVLDTQKLRVVINKEQKVRGISDKTIIGGMAFYNDPAMSFMTELFDRNTIKYFTIPFEMQTYTKYLEGLVNCSITLNGYSKIFMESLKQLGNSVYPLINNKNNTKGKGKKNQATTNAINPNGNFSSNMNDTLNQMKNRY